VCEGMGERVHRNDEKSDRRLRGDIIRVRRERLQRSIGRGAIGSEIGWDIWKNPGNL
jgi:hypothetical protein